MFRRRVDIKKEVILTNDNKKILGIYAEIDRKFLDDQNKYQARDPKKREDSFLGRSKVFSWLGFTDSQMTLPELENNLTAQADRLRTAYIETWNLRLKKCYFEAEKIEKVFIEDPIILIYEILRRLVTAALAFDPANPKHDGKKIKAALVSFIDKITQQNILSQDDHNQQQIIQFLNTTHKDWESVISELLESDSVSKQHIKAISQCIQYLEAAQLSIKRQISVYLESELSPSELHPNQIESTFKRCVRQAIAMVSGSSYSALIAKKTMLPEEIEKIFLTNKDKLNYHFRDHDKILKLLALLKETNLLSLVFEKIGVVMSGLGWLALITKVIKLDKLSERLKQHGSECVTTLYVAEKSSLFKTKSGKALVKWRMVSGDDLKDIAILSSSELLKLEDPKILQEVCESISDAFEVLEGIQRRYGLEIIDASKLNALSAKKNTSIVEGGAPKSEVIEVQEILFVEDHSEKLRNLEKQREGAISEALKKCSGKFHYHPNDSLNNIENDLLKSDDTVCPKEAKMLIMSIQKQITQAKREENTKKALIQIDDNTNNPKTKPNAMTLFSHPLKQEDETTLSQKIETSIDNNELAQLYFQRGKCWIKKKDEDWLVLRHKAVSDFTIAIYYNRKHAQSWVELAYTYELIGKGQEAINAYTEALKIDPNHYFALCQRGGLLMFFDDVAAGEKDFIASIELRGDDPNTYKNRGKQYLYLGEYEKAILDFEQTLKLEQNSKNPREIFINEIKVMLQEAKRQLNMKAANRKSHEDEDSEKHLARNTIFFK